MSGPNYRRTAKGRAATAAAAAAAGWGTALKPAWEPILLCRKPLDGTVAQNVRNHGTGAIHIDACRVGFSDEADKAAAAAAQMRCQPRAIYGGFGNDAASLDPYLAGMEKGRWPANLIHDGSEQVQSLFPATAGGKRGSFQREMTSRGYRGGGLGQRKAKDHAPVPIAKPGYADHGSAARFFYCAKARQCERENNAHPTVKPLALMRYLCRLVTPPGGLILDPFMGSGTTGKAARLEGFRFIGIEKEEPYVEIARRRIHGITAITATAG